MTEGQGQGQGGSEPIGPPYGGPAQPGGYHGDPWTQSSLGPAGGGGPAKGFLASLFDFSFSSFVTTKVVKVLYVLIVVLVALYTLGLLAFGFRLGTGAGLLFLLVICPLFFLASVAVYRVLLELMVVIFRMAEDVADIRRRGGPTPLV